MRAASKLKPDWDLAALLEAQLLQRQSNALALQRLAAFLERYPKAREVRMSYARMLVAERKYTEARAEFQTLSKDFPDNVDVVFAVGVLSLQLQDYALAEANFKRLLALPYRDKNTVRLYLGQIAEEQKNYPEALRWYEEVAGGEQYLQAQMRYALVLEQARQAGRGARAPAAGRGRQRAGAGAAVADRGAVAARRQPAARGVRADRARARRTCPTSPSCSTTTPCWRRSSIAWTCSRRNLKKLISCSPTTRMPTTRSAIRLPTATCACPRRRR